MCIKQLISYILELQNKELILMLVVGIADIMIKIQIIQKGNLEVQSIGIYIFVEIKDLKNKH